MIWMFCGFNGKADLSALRRAEKRKLRSRVVQSWAFFVARRDGAKQSQAWNSAELGYGGVDEG
jgi:hypothetical protein